MNDEFEARPGDEGARFSDSQDYKDLLHRFKPNAIYGSYLSSQAEYISHYLNYGSADNRVAGLLAHQSAILAGINRGLSRLLVVLAINTALVGYIVYRMF